MWGTDGRGGVPPYTRTCLFLLLVAIPGVVRGPGRDRPSRIFYFFLFISGHVRKPTLLTLND